MKNYTMIRNGKALRFCAANDEDALDIADKSVLLSGHAELVSAQNPRVHEEEKLYSLVCTKMQDLGSKFPKLAFFKDLKVHTPSEHYRGLKADYRSLTEGYFSNYPESAARGIWFVLRKYRCLHGSFVAPFTAE